MGVPHGRHACESSCSDFLLSCVAGLKRAIRLCKIMHYKSSSHSIEFITDSSQSIETDATRPAKRAAPVHWLPPSLVHSSRSLGTHATTAQVHPRLFTTFIAEQFQKQPNTAVVYGTATSLAMTSDSNGSQTFGPTGVKVRMNAANGDKAHVNGANGANGVNGTGEEQIIPADVVVIAAGPWTGKVALELLGNQVGRRLGVTGHRAHSIVLKTKEELTPHCLFTNMTMEDGSVGEPEVYARPDGTTYMCVSAQCIVEFRYAELMKYRCGAGDSEPLPATAAEVKPSQESINLLKSQARALSHVFTDEYGVEVQAEQACYLPVADRGRPLIGKVRGVEGVFVGSG